MLGITFVQQTFGFILVIFVLSFVARYFINKRIATGGLADGVPGQAVITGMGQTGTTINQQPQLTFALQVQLPGQAPYPVEITQTVPFAAMGLLAPGRTVAVRVSPKSSNDVRIDIQGSMQQAALAGAAAAGGPGAAVPGAVVRSNDDLVATGQAVAAEVLAVQDTGQFYGTDPIATLSVRVHAPSGPYEVQVTHRVPADRRPRLVPGVTLRGHIDANDRNALGIDWRAL